MSRQDAVLPQNKPNAEKQNRAAGGKLQPCFTQPASGPLLKRRPLLSGAVPAQRRARAGAPTPASYLVKGHLNPTFPKLRTPSELVIMATGLTKTGGRWCFQERIQQSSKDRERRVTPASAPEGLRWEQAGNYLGLPHAG